MCNNHMVSQQIECWLMVEVAYEKIWNLNEYNESIVINVNGKLIG